MIYLVNPSEKKILDNAGDRMPIGLMSIGAYMKQKGHDVQIWDLNHDMEDELLRRVTYQDTVGISVYTSPHFSESVRLAKELKGAKLIAGGHHATHMPETLFPYFNAVVLGEGEKGFEKAMQKDGVVYSDPSHLNEIDNLDYDMVDTGNYGISSSGRRTGTIITSRGCPNSCSFCGKLEDKVRFEPIEKIRQQIDQLKERGFNSIYFLDDVFTVNKKRMVDITDWMYQANMPFRVTTRANLVDESKMQYLAEDGCEWMNLGIESGSDEVLKRVNKGMDTKTNLDAVRLAGKHGIKTKGFFIIGLPGETERTAKQTIDFAKRLRQHGLSDADFYYLTPFPGTPIWNNPHNFGIEIIDRAYTKYLQAGKRAKCVVNTEKLKSKRIEELVEEAKEEWKTD